MPPGSPWTTARVGEQLIAAFRRLPDHPVMSRGRRPGFDEFGGGVVEPFGWVQLFVEDRHDRAILLTWARCRAIGASVTERYKALDWNRDTSERRRRKALATITRGLEKQARCNESLTVQSLAPELA